MVDFIVRRTVAEAAAQAAERADGDAPSALAATPAEALERYIAAARPWAGDGPWEAFLRRAGPHAADAQLVTFAATRDDNPWCLLSRALILLRVAAGAVRRGMGAAGVLGAPELADWAHALSLERSLVDSAVDDLHDLWEDIEVALAAAAPAEEMLRRLETSERVALWAVAA
jgi:hypothetical protein